MTNRLLLIWALLASFVAVGAIGYSLGKDAAMQTLPAGPTAASVPMNTDGSRADAAPAFSVPALFEGAPREWRTAVAQGRATGYAALFDPLRREIIIEQCRHPGYPIDDNGRPVENRSEFCAAVLWAQLDQLTENAATAMDRRGQRVAIRLQADLEATPPTLRVSFPGHDMALIPGSKNDLYQAIEADPAIKSAKRAYHRAMSSGGTDDDARRLAADRAASPAADLPRYTLPPASAPQADGETDSETPGATSR